MKSPRLARTGRVEKARSLSDEALLEDLHRLGITMDAAGLRLAANAHASAEAFAHALNADLRPRLRGAELDELRADLTVLWERLLPPSPQPATFEAIEGSMRAGYLAQMRGDQAAAARAWMRTWDAVAAIARERGFATIEEFDQAFRGTEYVFNWVQDLDDVFHNSGLDDHRFWEDALRIADEVLRLFPNESALFTENKRRVIAESHAKLGRRAVSDDLYRRWLTADPAWGWGWIGWADTYYLLVRGEERDAARAESILHDGLAVADGRDRPDILDRLVALYEDTGREDEATETRRRLRELEGRPAEPSVTVSRDPETGSGKVSFDFGEEGLPLERLTELPDRARKILAATGEVTRKKVGRNESCPCGSGRKFKKCCGREAEDPRVRP